MLPQRSPFGVCMRSGSRSKLINPCPKNYKLSVTSSSNDLAKNLPAPQQGIRIAMFPRGCVAIIIPHLHSRSTLVQVVRAVLASPPSAAMLDDFLNRVAKVYGIDWTPGLRLHEKLDPLILSHET